MKLIKGYQQWLNENFQAIFENWEIDSLYPSTDGFAIDDAKYDQYLASQPGQQFKQFTFEVSKSSVTNIKTKQYQQEIFGAIVRHGQTAKKGFLGIFGNKSLEEVVNATLDSLIAGQSKLNYTKATAEYNMSGTDAGSVFTSGKISGSAQGPINTDPRFAKATSRINFVLAFCNAYNTKAFETGQGQFILSTRLQEDGYLDLVSAPTIDADNLYLYSQQLLGDQAVGKEVTTTVTQTGGTDATQGKFAAEFAAGSDQLTPAIQAEVAKAVELCIAKFPAGQRPDKFTLTSGASTEWNGKQMPKAAGTGAVTPSDDATKNQDLAYRRGVAFMNALNAGLKAKGHPGFDSYEVEWSIGLSGQQANAADRFVDLNIAKNAVKPKATENTTATGTTTGSAVSNVRAKGQFYELKLNFVPAATTGK
jgi:hypothetical protein